MLAFGSAAPTLLEYINGYSASPSTNPEYIPLNLLSVCRGTSSRYTTVLLSSVFINTQHHACWRRQERERERGRGQDHKGEGERVSMHRWLWILTAGTSHTYHMYKYMYRDSQTRHCMGLTPDQGNITQHTKHLVGTLQGSVHSLHCVSHANTDDWLTDASFILLIMWSRTSVKGSVTDGQGTPW